MQAKRKCLDLSAKVSVINYAKEHPGLGARKIAKHFETGRTQVQNILKKKTSILDLFESNNGEVSRSDSTQANTPM